MMRKTVLLYLIFVLILGLFRAMTPQLGIVDDAWITYTYARNLAAGEGIVFNPGERVEGCTAFLHMVLLAPFSWLTTRLDWVATVLNILAWAGVALLVWSFIRRRDGGPTGVLGLFATGFVLIGFSGLAWAYSGMEMSLVGLAWIGAAKLHLWEREKDRLPWLSALIVVTAGLLRPDGILVAIPLTLSIWLEKPKKLAWGKAIVFSAIVLSLFGGYWLWRWHYFGYLLPNTFYAKVTKISTSLTGTGLLYLSRWFFGMVVPLLGLTAMVSAWRERIAPRWVKVMMGLVATSIGYCLLVGADFFSYHRFLLPSFAPMVLVSWWYGVAALAKRRRTRRPSTLSRTGKLVAAFLLFGLFQSIYFVGRVPPQGLVHGFIVQNTKDWAFVADLLRRVTPPETQIATIPIGAMGYFSHRYILDLVGLTDVHIAHAQVPTGVAITGHEKYDIDYVMRRRPELILTWPGLMPHGQNGLVKWVMSNIGAEAQKKLLADSRTPREYRLVWLLSEGNRPIQRGSLERWQNLKNGYWSKQEPAKGVIGLIRADLLGQPGYESFTPMDPVEADWLWRAFQLNSRLELNRHLFGLPPDKGK